MQVVCVMNRKGGVGKTSNATNLAHAIARQGKKVIIVDADSQGNATSILLKSKEYEKIEGLEKEKIFNLIPFEIADVFLEKCYLEDAIKPCRERENLFILPTRKGQFSQFGEWATTKLINEYNAFSDLNSELEKLGFDFIIYDMSPSDTLLERRIVKDADIIIGVLEPEFLAIEGIGEMNAFIESVLKKDKKVGKWNRVIINNSNGSRSDHKDYSSIINNVLEDKLIYNVKTDARISQAQSEYKTIYEYANSPESENDRTIPEFNRMAQDLIEGVLN